MTGIQKTIDEVKNALDGHDGDDSITISKKLIKKVVDYLEEYEGMCPRDAREFLNCGHDCKECYKCGESDSEETCLTCRNSFSDRHNELHCMAEGHNPEETVPDDGRCDDWE